MSERKDGCAQCACVLLALLLVQLVMHLNADNLLLDDWVFYAVREGGQSVPAYLAQRWQTWSSRLIIEGALCFLTHSIWTWRVLDSLMMVLMAYSLCRLANAERRPGMLGLAVLMVTAIPFAILRSTGWMATSLNYYWPLTLTATALIPLSDALWQRKTGRGMAFMAIPCAVFGANQEQTAAVLVGAYLVLGAALFIRDRRMRLLLPAIFAIAVAQLALHLLCPGNRVRAAQSIAMVNLRDYRQFSLIDKLSIGLTSTTALLFFTYNPLLLGCGALTAGTVTARRRGALAQGLVLLLSAFVLRAFFADATKELCSQMAWNRPFAVMQTYALLLGPYGVGDAVRMIMMFVTVCMLGLMALSLYLSIGHRPLAAVSVFAFALGFAARMALSFSPTVVESGERTMLPLYGAMMLCALLCARDCGADGSRRWPVAAGTAVLALVAAANVAGSFALAA